MGHESQDRGMLHMLDFAHTNKVDRKICKQGWKNSLEFWDFVFKF